MLKLVIIDFIKLALTFKQNALEVAQNLKKWTWIDYLIIL